MKYIINHSEDGKILGFAEATTDINTELTNAQYVEAQKFNKIIITDGVVSFEKVDWRTASEILEQEQATFRATRDNLLKEADIEIYRLEDNAISSTAWRTYRQALRDATLAWVMPDKPL